MMEFTRLELTRPDIELALAVLVVTFLTLCAYRLGERYRPQSERASRWVFLGTIGIAFFFAWSLFGRLIWAEAIQTSAVLYWSNVTPIVLGFTAGMSSHAADVRLHMRSTMASVLMTLAILFVITPIARPLLFPLKLNDSKESQHLNAWRGGVYLQTNESSCAPAAAVTLLSLAGIQSTEQDLAESCLSSSLGTAPLGLYRGLSLVAQANEHHARVASRNPDHWTTRGQLPNVALVRFSAAAGSPPTSGFLGNASVGHVVTVLGKTDGDRWLIGDPAVGRISWSDAELRARFTGEAIYLTETR